MNLFGGSAADLLGSAFRSDRLGQIGDTHTGDLRNENFASSKVFDTTDDKANPLLEGHPETGHAAIRDRQPAGLPLLLEKRDDASSASDNIPVSNTSKARSTVTGIRIALNEELLRAKFCRTIKRGWIDRLVCAERHDALHTLLESGIDHRFPT